MATARARAPTDRTDASPATLPAEHVADQARVIHGATNWAAMPLCAVFSHRWSTTPWSRWAFGWDREVICRRCGQVRHERARLHADLPYAHDR